MKFVVGHLYTHYRVADTIVHIHLNMQEVYGRVGYDKAGYDNTRCISGY